MQQHRIELVGKCRLVALRAAQDAIEEPLHGSVARRSQLILPTWESLFQGVMCRTDTTQVTIGNPIVLWVVIGNQIERLEQSAHIVQGASTDEIAPYLVERGSQFRRHGRMLPNGRFERAAHRRLQFDESLPNAGL